MTLRWPPHTKTEMLAWQTRYGSDSRIASAAGTIKRKVEYQRAKFNVGRVRPSTLRRGNASEKEIALIYGDARYEDAKSKSPPVTA